MKIATTARAKIAACALRTRRSEREPLAREAGESIFTLERDMRKYKLGGKKALERKARNDRGRSRKLYREWINLICAVFFLKAPASYRETHRQIVAACARRRIGAPSYSFIRRWVAEALRRATASGRIRRIGDFERRKGKDKCA